MSFPEPDILGKILSHRYERKRVPEELFSLSGFAIFSRL